ncbi:ComF family protein [Helicobacter baculiformis]|uniref:ComF family protein n=1 Tax=Helicobacter baculiformis TaxID=427351 RepID=A0ABV7ZHW1_9HELI|nr:amidophosphoribosyltransferase [Helicobacter baculiformis]
MRCVLCEAWVRPFNLVCARCNSLLEPQILVRKVEGVAIYGFYCYEEIEILLKSKYDDIGSRLLALLARKARLAFQTRVRPNLNLPNPLYGIALDDTIKRAYAPTAVILRQFCQQSTFKPLYYKLSATKPITYAGQSLAFRQSHTKDFVYRGKSPLECFVVDDIFTTGTTMQQALQTLARAQVRVCFGVVLAHTSKH